MKASDSAKMSEYILENLLFKLKSEFNYPIFAVAFMSLRDMSKPARYTCQEEDVKIDVSHFDLNSDFYTHFTSPIRRYVDIIVHRMLKSLLMGRNDFYSKKELLSICNSTNTRTAYSKKFDKKLKIIELAENLKTTPLICFAFVQSVDENNLKLIYPYVSYKNCNIEELPYSMLSPNRQPFFSNKQYEVFNSVTIHWLLQIFDANKTEDKCDNASSISKKRFIKFKSLRKIIIF